MIRRIQEEAARAHGKYGDFASMHEAYGVLAEEVEELFEAVRMKPAECRPGPTGMPMGRGACIEAEAIQVAAVALRIAEQARKVTR